MDIRRIYLADPRFQEQNVYLQAVLPFFIDGATPIEPDQFWQYFLLYDRASGAMVALFTVFEAHQTIDKIRAKISQVLVLQPYQRQGIASQVYEIIYQHFRSVQTCKEIIVEDAAEEFQKV